ncbi:alpha/beta fold hydrolase [Streptomyces sp. NBC_01538]
MWLRRFHSSPGDRARLVCFPHAGGSASQFFPLSKALTPTVDMRAVQYPGRQDRRNEPCVEDLGELAAEIFDVLQKWTDLPLALFGHSMGAVLACEVAARLEEAVGPGSVTRLFVSGRRAPSCRRIENVHALDDEGLKAEIRLLNGTAPELLHDEEVLAMILPVLRSDYRAIETHHGDPAVRLTCPITILTGDDDPHVSLEEARRWSRHTTGGSDLMVFPGGHFYLDDHVQEIADLISDALRGVRSSR